MNVLFVSQYLNGGGLERMVQLLGETLARDHGCKAYFYAFDGEATPELLKFLESKKITPIFKPKSQGFSFKTIFALAKIVREKKIDIIHTHESAPLIYAVAAKVAAIAGIPIVHTQHSFVHLKTKPYIRYYDRFFQCLAAKVTVVSKLVKDEYVKLGVSPDQLMIVDNGVEFPDRALEPSEKKELRLKLMKEHADGAWLVSLARIHNRKGQARLIDIWNALSDEARSKSTLIFVGPVTDEAEHQKLLAMKTASKNNERILFAGPSSEPTLWLQAADIFLSGSEYEGLPLAPLEAAGAGIPTVLSDIPGHDSFELALKFPFNEPRKGATHIESLLKQVFSDAKGAAKANWEKAATVRARFGADKMAEKYFKIYQDLI